MKTKLFQSLALVSILLGGTDLMAANVQGGLQPADGARLHAEKTDLAATTTAAVPAAVPAVEPAIIKKTEISNFDFWHLQCDQYADPKTNKRCFARMPVYKANGQQMLAVLMIAQDEDGKAWQLKVVIPTSISIQDGASIEFDASGKPQNFPIDTCEPQACASNLPFDAPLQQALKAASKVTLSWIGIDHSPIKIDFEIKGIQQTMKAMFG